LTITNGLNRIRVMLHEGFGVREVRA
jgi:hypothetical protein